jgi:hypothetical protein
MASSTEQGGLKFRDKKSIKNYLMFENQAALKLQDSGCILEN